MKAAVCCEFGKSPVVEEAHLDQPRKGEVKVGIASPAIFTLSEESLAAACRWWPVMNRPATVKKWLGT